MIYLVYALVIIGYFLLPVLVSLAGNDQVYESGEGSPMLILFKAALFVLIALILCKKLYNGAYISLRYCVLIPVLFSLGFLCENIFLTGNFYERSLYAYEVFALYSWPGLWVGAILAIERKDFYHVMSFIYILTAIISIVSLLAIPKMLIAGRFLMGNTNYQIYSYSMSLCFGLTLCFLLFRPSFVYSFLRTRICKYIFVVLLPLQILCVLLSGGRGGAILLFANVLVLVLIYNYSRGLSAYRIIIPLFAIIFLVSIGVMLVLNNNSEFSELFSKGFERAFAYVSDDGIDTSKTSGRDNLFLVSIQRIIDNPLGYGVFRQFALFDRPHNLVLEILLDGGFLLFIISLVVFIRFYYRFKKIIKLSLDYVHLVPTTLYAFVMLLFSGTYLFTEQFWFIIAFVFTFNLNTKRKVSYNL